MRAEMKISILGLILFCSSLSARDIIRYNSATEEQLVQFNQGAHDDLFIKLEEGDYLTLEDIAKHALSPFNPDRDHFLDIKILQPAFIRKTGSRLSFSYDMDKWDNFGAFFATESDYELELDHNLVRFNLQAK